jgi:hypothetical protein
MFLLFLCSWVKATSVRFCSETWTSKLLEFTHAKCPHRRPSTPSRPTTMSCWSYVSVPSLLLMTLVALLTSLLYPLILYAKQFIASCTARMSWVQKKQIKATRHDDARGERRYSSYSFLTSALDGGEWSASRPDRVLAPGKGPPVPIVQEAGWAPEPVWAQRIEEKSFAPARDRTPIARSSSP